MSWKKREKKVVTMIRQRSENSTTFFSVYNFENPGCLQIENKLIKHHLTFLVYTEFIFVHLTVIMLNFLNGIIHFGTVHYHFKDIKIET